MANFNIQMSHLLMGRGSCYHQAVNQALSDRELMLAFIYPDKNIKNSFCMMFIRPL
jgi:hypothetical protein